MQTLCEVTFVFAIEMEQINNIGRKIKNARIEKKRRKIKIIVFFYLFFLLNNPEFSHRAQCETPWNAASTFRVAIKHNGRQFDRLRERKNYEREPQKLGIVSRATLRIYKSRVYTRARGPSNARNLSSSALPRLGST